MKIDSYISGPRWAGVREFIYEASAATGVELVSVDSDKGFFRETVYFSVEGDISSLKKFARLLEIGVENYNG